ncbi:MAG: histone deacetylase [Saprospiraceae bacterium]|nr:histone deacetylase [Saprospiraceae bacterium]MDP4701100.1 histone deacetylase [Saprospiraceae bacterium]MDP4811270.1 histone deacetylase [Saprospiraceae bacterium]MDP4813110.1 histone deacetylase [Saprospiraceae bacterium]MDP4914662.1 histone deacetylase [Saprospiraceae bacterium]
MLQIAFSPIYEYPLPKGHRFPMDKYSLIPQQLLYEGTVQEKQFFHPDPISEEIILLTHSAKYWEDLKNQTLSEKEIRAIGFPMTPLLVERGRHIAAGTLQCVEYAVKHGISMNAAGGTHHAFKEKGEGFCVFNDIAIAANYLIHSNKFNNILIVDLDVHQGNGSASIFNGQGQVFTFSMHGAKNYPFRKEASHLDIGLPDGTEDDAYLKILFNILPRVIDQHRPELIFYQAGVDILTTDRLGRLSVSREGCRKRDKYVMEICKKNKIPLVVTMGGGYSPQLSHIIEAHANTFRTATEVYF